MTKEAELRSLGAMIFFAAAIAAAFPAMAGEALPESGSAKLAAYQICRPLTSLDLGAAGSESFTECNGIVKDLDGQKLFDNLLMRCVEDASARPPAYRYSGTCVQTDADGDKLFMTYDGTRTGAVKWIGGTGKFAKVTGSGTLSVVVAPSDGPGLFAYTLNVEGKWTNGAK